LIAGGRARRIKKDPGRRPAFLAPGGLLALETGIAHHAELLRLAARRFFTRGIASGPGGRDRYVLAVARE